MAAPSDLTSNIQTHSLSTLPRSKGDNYFQFFPRLCIRYICRYIYRIFCWCNVMPKCFDWCFNFTVRQQQHSEASRSKSSHNWLNSCPLCRAFVPQAFVARGDLPTAVCGKCNMIGGSCHWSRSRSRHRSALVAVAVDDRQLRFVSPMRRRRRLHRLRSVPRRVLHRFVTCSGFILHCAFHIS